jgi:hypothetical protein
VQGLDRAKKGGELCGHLVFGGRVEMKHIVELMVEEGAVEDGKIPARGRAGGKALPKMGENGLVDGKRNRAAGRVEACSALLSHRFKNNNEYLA